jgi:uncharacterized membrane protein
MNFRILLPGIWLWLVMLVLAFANGTLREFVLNPRLGSAIGHVISTLLLLLLFVLVIYLFVRKFIDKYSSADMLLLGIFLMVLTVLFEFWLGARRGMSPGQMLADYNIFKGRIWALIPLAELLAPYVIYKAIRK